MSLAGIQNDNTSNSPQKRSAEQQETGGQTTPNDG